MSKKIFTSAQLLYEPVASPTRTASTAVRRPAAATFFALDITHLAA
jgi:hypothetical protein